MTCLRESGQDSNIQDRRPNRRGLSHGAEHDLLPLRPSFGVESDTESHIILQRRLVLSSFGGRGPLVTVHTDLVAGTLTLALPFFRFLPVQSQALTKGVVSSRGGHDIRHDHHISSQHPLA
jgi:hypothetical protein